MKIEKEIIYNIVTSEGARLEVSEQELVELYVELKKIVPTMPLPAANRLEHDKKLTTIWSYGEY